MKTLLVSIFVVFAVISVVSAQNDGRYRPEPRPTVLPTTRLPSLFTTSLNSGRYTGDGRYRSDNAGRYSNTDGRYRPSNDGKYHPDDSGRYTGSADPYKHIDVGGGQYTGSRDVIPPYKDLQSPDKNRQTSPPKATSPAPKPTRPPQLNIVVNGPGIGDINSQYTDASGQSTLGVATGLEQGSATGLYDNRNYRIIVDDKESQSQGNYHYKYETENKIFGEETGSQVGSGDEVGAAATGYYRYTGPDNIVYTVNYHAGPEGFVAKGAHIPTPPPIPDLILRALEYQRKVGTLK